MKTLDDKLNRLRPARRRKIEARAAALIAEEMSLQELRKARQWTQVRLAQVLGTGQDSISRLEQRSDLLLSTLRGYVEVLGGRLELIVKFQDRAPVQLNGFMLVPLAPSTAVPRRHAKAKSSGLHKMTTRPEARHRAKKQATA